MGRDRTHERRAESRERRAAKRQAIADDRARGLAERADRIETTKEACREASGGERTVRFFFRRDLVSQMRFSPIQVPYKDDPAHPERGVVETTKAVQDAIESQFTKTEPN